MNRATVYIVALAIGCTALGVVGGVAIEKRYTRRHFPQIARREFFRHHEGLPFQRGQVHQRRAKATAMHPMQRIVQELNLNAEQEAKVRAILEKTKQQATQARDEFKAQIEKAKEDSNAQILKLLTPEQKEKFEQLTARMKKKRAGK